MARSTELPGFRDKRKVLFGQKVTPEQRLAMGRRFAEAERFDDALEFFARTDAEQDVRRIAEKAVQRGDTALLLRAKVVLKEAPTAEELADAARAAERAGKLSMAYMAHVKAGNQAEAERLRAQLPTDESPEEAAHAPPTPEDEEPQSG